MLNTIIAQAGGQNEFITQVFIYLAGLFIAFIIGVYIIRAIFDIPKIVRLHKTQIRLLEEIAKVQGVDGQKVQSIITESAGWDTPA